MSTDECEVGAIHISSYQDTLIFNLHPSPFAIRFRHLAIGWRRKLAREPAWMPEQTNDLGLKCRT
jgi:hypothetical protein